MYAHLISCSKIKKRICAVLSVLLVITMINIPSLTGSFPVIAEAAEEDDDLLLHYTFDDDSNLAKDSSGNGNDGKAFGKLKSVSGARGKGLLFDSSSHQNSESYIEMPVDVFKRTEITIMVWVKYDPDTVGNYSRIFAIETGSTSRVYHLMTNAGNEAAAYKFEMFGGSPSSVNIMTEGMYPASVLKNWHHVAFTFNGNAAKIYINGSFIHSVNVSSDVSVWNIAHAYLGKTRVWGDGTFNGYMDDVRVYSKALNEGEICSKAGLNEEEQGEGVKLLSSLSVGGKELPEFDAFCDTYFKTLDDGVKTAPTVSATAPFSDSGITVKQAESVPGKAVITVRYSGGATRTVTVCFIKRNESNYVHPDITDVKIDDAFWNEKLKMYAEVTAPYVLGKWASDTHSNLKNFDKVAKGDRNTGNYVGGMTWGESDFYASMAGASLLLLSYPNEALKAQIDSYVDHIFPASESEESGYFSVYNLLMTNGKVFSEADSPWKAMDLFNLGYLIEFGMAYYRATGDARMLRVALRFANFTVNYSDHGKVNFVSFHTGVEYNLIALYEFLKANLDVKNEELLKDLTINEDDYLELAYHFISYRGVFEDPARLGGKAYGTYGVDHLPYTEQTRGTGHAVESTLFYYALAEMGRVSGDNGFTDAAYRIWNNIVYKQMYVTGGTGSVYQFEGFGGDYYLPNYAYCETCSSGALLQYSDSLSLMFSDSQFQNIVELEMYNNLLGGVGANGNTFFYQNPLETASASRWSWHGVPCCTKYGLLVYGSLPKYVYSYSGNDISFEQYIGSTGTLHLSSGDVTLYQKSDWAWNGTSEITVKSGAGNIGSIRLRLPDWSDSITVKVNGKNANYTVVNGYAYLSGSFSDGDKIEIIAKVETKRVYADERVSFDTDRVAFRRSVFVYCFEGVDNTLEGIDDAENYIVINRSAKTGTKKINDLYGGITAITVPAKLYTAGSSAKDVTATAIPFYARSNRGESSVLVWAAESEEVLGSLPVKISEDTPELRTLGAKYKGITNAKNPQGGGSKDISVIVDGDRHFSVDTKQYDGFRATLTDDLGKKKHQWFGAEFDKEYTVSYVVFWEGGHWNDGGWFGSAPYLQVKVDGEWKDVETILSPEYPGDSFTAQSPSNESYTFVLKTPVKCSAVRVAGAPNGLAGHASCAEIEVFGKNVETSDPGTDKPGTDKPVTDKPITDKPVTDKTTSDKPNTDKPATDDPVTDDKKPTENAGKGSSAGWVALGVGAAAAGAAVIAAALIIRRKKKQ